MTKKAPPGNGIGTGQELPAVQGSLFDVEASPTTARIIKLADVIAAQPPEEPDFLHSILCQVGLPRQPVKGDRFERRNGAASLLIQSGELWTGKEWVRQPIPNGTRPRLVLVYVSSQAVRSKSPVVEVGGSVREFLRRLGVDQGGREHALLNKQIQALSACHMSLGFNSETIDAKPIERFDAWENEDTPRGVIKLSAQFFDSLTEFAVPLDPRALAGLKHSALALDVYTWLAHRLIRVTRVTGDRVSWAGLKDQFGQEYADIHNFKRKIKKALAQVCEVYPDARITTVRGGLLLEQSRPPVPKTFVAQKLPKDD